MFISDILYSPGQARNSFLLGDVKTKVKQEKEKNSRIDEIQVTKTKLKMLQLELRITEIDDVFAFWKTFRAEKDAST